MKIWESWMAANTNTKRSHNSAHCSLLRTTVNPISGQQLKQSPNIFRFNFYRNGEKSDRNGESICLSLLQSSILIDNGMLTETTTIVAMQMELCRVCVRVLLGTFAGYSFQTFTQATQTLHWYML